MFDCFCLLYVDLHHQGLERQGEETPEEKIKAMEKRVGTLWFYINMIDDQVTELIEESCLAGSRGENKVVLVVGMVLSGKTFSSSPSKLVLHVLFD